MAVLGQKLNPFLECRVETLTGPSGNGHIFIIRASHMSRMAEFLPVESISLGYPGFRAEKTKTEGLGRSIEGKSLGETDTVSLNLLSNAAFMGLDANGLLTPAVRAGDGSYHITGALTTAPPTTLKRLLANCGALGSALGGARILLICSVLRYVFTQCCDDPSHIINFGNEDDEEELMDFQEQHRQLLGVGVGCGRRHWESILNW